MEAIAAVIWRENTGRQANISYSVNAIITSSTFILIMLIFT